MEHVTGDEKYVWEMLNVVMRESRMMVGSVCCTAFSGSLLGILYLYLWYSHTTSVSNDCVGSTRPCVMYCCDSHFILVVGMMMRCLPISS